MAERLRTIGKGGGLILALSHHVQHDTPIENLMAMLYSIDMKSVFS